MKEYTNTNLPIRRTSSCWLWTGTKTDTGYGLYKGIGAHRHVFELHSENPIPQGMVIDHKCGKRICVNPSHLRLVTPRENCLENNSNPFALNALKKHCKRGHKFTLANTKLRPQSGGRPGFARMCRTCAARRSNRLYHERKAEISALRKRKRAEKE